MNGFIIYNLYLLNKQKVIYFNYIRVMFSKLFINGSNKIYRFYSTSDLLHKAKAKIYPSYIEFNANLAENPQLATNLVNTMKVYDNFLTEHEENSIFEEIEPYMSRLKYEFDHWDDAIHGYRETERLKWNEKNTKILDRVREIAFPPGVGQLKHVHILDLDQKGYIKPHIDAVRFCGDTIAGLSLLSDSVMRLVNEKEKDKHAKILLKRRSLYIMKGTARFDYTHEILHDKESYFGGEHIERFRRISVICRNEPDPNNTKV